MPTLHIAVRNYADFVNALAEQARQFEALTPGVHVELHTSGIHDLYRSTISDCGLRSGRFDLALLGTDWLAEGLAIGALEDLAPWHARQPIPDWPTGWPPALVRTVTRGMTLSSIPWHDGPECLVYRSDLFADPDLRAAFRTQHQRDLAPPATWAEFETVARFFTGARPGLFGTVFAAFPDGHNTLYDFALQLWSRGGEFVDVEGLPRIDTPAAVGALDYYRRIVRDPLVCHPDSPRLDSNQSGDLFLSGNIAMMANWFGFAARSSAPGSPLHGKVAIAGVPSDGVHPSTSLTVFWSMAMGTGSREKDLAWQFLRFAAAPERDLGLARHGAVPCRLSSWRNPELQMQIPVYRQLEAISLGSRSLPTGPRMAGFASILDNVITQALTSDRPSLGILREAQRNIASQGLAFA